MGQLVCLDKMTLVTGYSQSAWRSQVFKASTGPPSSNKSDNKDYKDPLGSNKLGLSEAPTEVATGHLQAFLFPIPQDLSTNCYSQQNLDRIIQTFLYISKSRFRNKLKAKTPDVYRDRSHMEYYNFCQQCEDHFAICGATGPN